MVGHNLKIAWNLMRMQSLKAKPEYVATARKLGDTMPALGSDLQRGGWYDVVEREPLPGRRFTASSGTTARRGGSRNRRSWPT